jgi:hypothetical protein
MEGGQKHKGYRDIKLLEKTMAEYWTGGEQNILEEDKRILDSEEVCLHPLVIS